MSRRYGEHQTEVQVDADWATLDVVVHWTLTCDDYRDLIQIDKITVGDRDLHEGWNEDYFFSIIQEEVDNSDYHWADNGV
jgi:hypothetical protein